MDTVIVVDADDFQITDPSEIGIFYRVIAKADGKVIGEVVSLPAARDLAKNYLARLRADG